MRKGTRPVVLFVAVSAAAFGLAQAHLLKPSASSAGTTVKLGDPGRGAPLFEQRCAGCHGQGGNGGGVGPALAGASLTSARVKAQIDAGGGVMPARLVTGKDEANVVAYVATITAK